jgi:hypothetical protein
MDTSVPALISLFFAFLLAALVGALIFSAKFRREVLGGPGEATIFNLITVKGVAIVLLCSLFIGGIAYCLSQIKPQGPPPDKGPVTMRVNIHFDPDDVNPRNPQFKASAFIKKASGPEPLPVLTTVSEGAMSVQLTLPDMETPFFVVFETPKGVWKTDDHSIRETAVIAHRQEGG